MFRKLTLTAAVALGLGATTVHAEGAISHVEDYAFSYEGPFGSFDQNQLQRGLQIYTEVCSACHGMKYVAIRTIGDAGGPAIPEDQVRAYAALFPLNDPDSNPQLFDREKGDYRPLTPADHFPANNALGAPDLSLMAKARAGFHGPYGTGLSQLFNGMGGPEYIASLLNGYAEPPACAPENFVGSYNTVFASGGFPESCKDEHGNHTVPGSWIGMAQPLYGDDVVYADGHDADLHHEAMDVAAFLMWTAEPKMMARKHAGLTGVIFLTILAALLYATNKRLWAPHKHKRDE
jgi:ubiquinol-cytochrome c reductase cytochrome c1 subunit